MFVSDPASALVVEVRDAFEVLSKGLYRFFGCKFQDFGIGFQYGRPFERSRLLRLEDTSRRLGLAGSILHIVQAVYYIQSPYTQP